LSDKKLTRAQLAAEPKKRKKMTVEEDSPKARRTAKATADTWKENKKDVLRAIQKKG
jgi:hypothetical protein